MKLIYSIYLCSSNIAALINNNYFSDTSCSKEQCWCVTNGGSTCQRWDNTWHGTYLLNGNCDFHGKCHPKAICKANGYWCDDSQGPGGKNQGLYYIFLSLAASIKINFMYC